MRTRPVPTCVLTSGGLDSAVLLARLLKRGAPVLPLYVRCGLRWEEAELAAVRRLLKALRSSRLRPLRTVHAPLGPLYAGHWSLRGRVPGARSADAAVYLPGRNLLLATYAAMACAEARVSTIAFGTLKGNPFGDATPEFFRSLGRCLTHALGRPIRIITPLIRVTKTQLIRSAVPAVLAASFSCLCPRGGAPCGACNKCAERRRAFARARVADPTRYAS